MTDKTVHVITGTIPPEYYTPVGIIHGHAETNDPAPLSHVAVVAVEGLSHQAAAVNADLVIDVQINIMSQGFEGMKVLATGTAVKLTNAGREEYANLITEAEKQPEN